MPLVRIYGSTPAGQKTLLHVHGVFPYVYIPFERDFKRQFVPENDDDPNSPSLNLLLVKIANSIDKALNISLGRGVIYCSSCLILYVSVIVRLIAGSIEASLGCG